MRVLVENQAFTDKALANIKGLHEFCIFHSFVSEILVDRFIHYLSSLAMILPHSHKMVCLA